MTKERPWPPNQKNRRDRAAEELATAEIQIRKLLLRVQAGEFTRSGLEICLLTINRHLQTSLRHLEKAGAPTEPQ